MYKVKVFFLRFKDKSLKERHYELGQKQLKKVGFHKNLKRFYTQYPFSVLRK